MNHSHNSRRQRPAAPLSSSCSPRSAWEQPRTKSALESAHKRGHESNTTGAGSNCSFLPKCVVRLKRSTTRRVRLFSLTAVRGACSPDLAAHKRGFSPVIVGRERGSADGEHSENTCPPRPICCTRVSTSTTPSPHITVKIHHFASQKTKQKTNFHVVFLLSPAAAAWMSAVITAHQYSAWLTNKLISEIRPS